METETCRIFLPKLVLIQRQFPSSFRGPPLRQELQGAGKRQGRLGPSSHIQERPYPSQPREVGSYLPLQEPARCKELLSNFAKGSMYSETFSPSHLHFVEESEL